MSDTIQTHPDAAKTGTPITGLGHTDPTYGEQPMPVPNENPAVWDLVKKEFSARFSHEVDAKSAGLVIHDMDGRDQVGLIRYGTRLQIGNGRNFLRDAYEEMLDAAVYTRGAIEEQKARGEPTLLSETLYMTILGFLLSMRRNLEETKA